MIPRRLYLKQGAEPGQAANTLRELITDARGLIASVAGGHRVLRLRDKYIDWVERAELQLSNFTIQPETLEMFQTSRYWHIREIDERSPRPEPLIRAEIEGQTAALERLVDDLAARVKRLSQSPGHITVLDTNALLEFQPPGQIEWTSVIGQTQVRLIVPLRVIEELDAKKYARRANVADRARRLLPQLERVLGVAGLPGGLRDGVTIEVPVAPGPRRRPTDADEEVLETCEELHQLTGRPVTLVTADTAMRLRANARSLSVVTMPAEYERTRDAASA